MVRGLADTETRTFGRNVLIHSAQFINIENIITLGKYLNGRVCEHYLAISLVPQI